MKSPAHENRTSRPLLLGVLIVVSLLLITGWYREGDGGPLHRIRDGVHTVVAPVSAVGEVITHPLRVVGGFFGDLGVSRGGIAELERQNAELRRRNTELEEARQQNIRLKQLLRFVQGKDLKTVGGHVIGRPNNAWEGVVTIDLGGRDGVKQGMPVVSGSGLLGQLIEVAPNSSRVRLITDQRSGVAAMVQRSRAEGIARGTIDGGLTLDFVSTDTTVNAGDAVVTSGMGGVYPKGLLVGEVTEVEKDPAALYQTIQMRPAATLGNTEEVLVIIGRPPAPKIGAGE
ncbi:MAG: rod shape-determining protein MreC [Coriobacteriales bacterium]|nr:rod shape-determining protein MreC [Coriobacteriales bacterium]